MESEDKIERCRAQDAFDRARRERLMWRLWEIPMEVAERIALEVYPISKFNP